jgi:hypothetical protein
MSTNLSSLSVTERARARAPCWQGTLSLITTVVRPRTPSFVLRSYRHVAVAVAVADRCGRYWRNRPRRAEHPPRGRLIYSRVAPAVHPPPSPDVAVAAARAQLAASNWAMALLSELISPSIACTLARSSSCVARGGTYAGREMGRAAASVNLPRGGDRMVCDGSGVGKGKGESGGVMVPACVAAECRIRCRGK